MHVVKMNMAIVLMEDLRMYMLCAKHGFAQSMDCAVQSMDPCFVQRSMNCLLNPWIAQYEKRKNSDLHKTWIGLTKVWL